MAKIIVRERDYTSPGSSDYSNFTVLVPGFVGLDYTTTEDKDGVSVVKYANPFDANGACLFTSAGDFREQVGLVPSYASETVTGQYGNQIAYELLNLGFSVLYVNLGYITEGGDTAEGIAKMAAADYEESMWKPFEDKFNYDFRFVLTGLVNGDSIVAANKNIITLASYLDTDENNIKGRGDCVALLDIADTVYLDDSLTSMKAMLNAIKNHVESKYSSSLNKYVKLFAPTVCFESNSLHESSDKEFEGNTVLPGSFYYLACYRKALSDGFKEWYAMAGQTRGVCDLTVDHATVNLGQAAIDALQPRVPGSYIDNEKASKEFKHAVNTIVNFRNKYYLYGNRTGHAISEDGLIASDFSNIRELCTSLKKQIFIACKALQFDPNNDILRVKFEDAVRPLLEKMKSNEGIEDYKFIRQISKKKGEFKETIRIIPIEAVEDFEINAALVDSIDGTTTTISETN